MIFVGLQLGMILSTLDGTIVATALPTIGRELSDPGARSWVITAYLLAQVATMPLYGKLGDHYPRKHLFLFAISLFTFGSVLCGAAQSLDQLIAFRVVQGLGSGGLGPLAMAVVGDIVPARQLGRWLGYQGALFAIASLMGPLVGGVFVDRFSWRWAFYVNLPIALVSIAIVALALHLPHRRVAHSIDYAGSALLTGLLVCVVLGASIGGRTVAWASPEMLALGGAIVLLTVLFVWRERRATEPIMPITLFTSRVARASNGLNLTSGALFASGIYFLPVFFQEVAGVDPTDSGLLLIPFMFATAFATLVAGRRVEAVGRYRFWPIAGGVLMTVGVGLLATLGAGSAVLVAAGFGAVLGTGVGFVMQTSLLALQNSTAPRDLGIATSAALLCRVLGITLGAAFASAVLQAGLPATPDPAQYASALQWVFVAALPVGLVALFVALKLPEVPLRERALVASDLIEVAP